MAPAHAQMKVLQILLILKVPGPGEYPKRSFLWKEVSLLDGYLI